MTTSGSWPAAAMLLGVLGTLAGCAEQPAPAPLSAAPAMTELPLTEPGPPSQASAPAAAPKQTRATAFTSCEARPGTDSLRRTAVLRTLDGGLGQWLRNVDVDPKLEHGRFRGWIIRTLPAGDACYGDLDLRAGDIVTRVNGRPVERPEEASDVWEGLRTSSALVIDFTRAGHPHSLRFKIVDAP